MVSSSLTVLDVGHGNAAVLADGEHVTVIDGGESTYLVNFIRVNRIERIHRVLVSHADRDHIGGITTLLAQSDIAIDEVWVNPDRRGGPIWELFRRMLEKRTHVTKTRPHLTRGDSDSFRTEQISIEVLSPSDVAALGTVDGTDTAGTHLDPNRMSVVLRIDQHGEPRVLVPGDIDATALGWMLDDGAALSAPVLLFPHHGGLPGDDDPRDFARRLSEAVHPQEVVFSFGRGRYGNPQPMTVAGVLDGAPDAYLSCTQLAHHCSASLPGAGTKYPDGTVATDEIPVSMCRGTIRINFDGTDHSPTQGEHRAFIERSVATPLCILTNKVV